MSPHQQLEHLGTLEALLVAATTADERVTALQARRQLLAEQEVVDVREQVPTGDHTEPQPSGRSGCTTFLVGDGWLELLLALARRRGVRADVSQRLGELMVVLEGAEGALQEIEVEFDELVEKLAQLLAETAREFRAKQVASAIDERLWPPAEGLTW